MTIKDIIKDFQNKNLDDVSLEFFKHLNVPLNRAIQDEIILNELFEEEYDEFKIIDKTYMIGAINDEVFKNNNSELELKIERYEGLLIFAINLNITTPSRTQLSKISRIFNRNFEYTPIVIIFKYGNKLSLSNTQRQEYKQKWREGEKVGKVSILRDIDIKNPHRGHLDILENMKINSKIKTYETLYNYWQEVFNVSLLNKKFYQELSNWYSYAVSEVVFPNQPKDTENIEKHNSQNLIRLLTRFLFVWFIKEKGLIPDEIFDEEYIKQQLKNFNPKNLDNTLFQGQDKSSLYYKAILQNLFFASLNCPKKPLDETDKRRRGFRRKNQNRDANFLMRYEDSFNNPQQFLELINEYVPFLNGGLFECLDDKTNKIYIDGFSDNLIKPHQLIVPDYLFFGIEENIDLSNWYGNKNKSFKNATVKGLIKILESYKFTIMENTPLEEDVALDPELLGRVFENLLASYNPETKTTARKQTGSFYTPREIVSYMVDESLIAYLKTKLENEYKDNNLEENLRKLCSYSDIQPFKNKEIISKLINAIDNLKVLDPAVGSGAFPMGMLQKMVHILSKLDPKNEYWKELQQQKVTEETQNIFGIKNKKEREKLLIEINNSFDVKMNNPDYARKLYILENSIYGVDIQSIAIQITKLRFFISIVIEQNIDKNKENFGIRPLPNLETKFISANTLIGIEKETNGLFDDNEIKKLEDELKDVRHKIFNAKSPKTKKDNRIKDKKLREEIAKKLKENGLGNENAKLLANWDPYKQNVSSPFFDMEWMFGIKDGFDIVIGNPPYVSAVSMARTKQEKKLFKELYPLATGTYDIYILFLLKGIDLLNKNGKYIWIIPNKFLIADYAIQTKKYLEKNGLVYSIDVSSFNVFENTNVYPIIILGDKENKKQKFNELLLENYKNLENRIFKKPIQFYNHKTFKDFNIKIASGTTGFEAQKIKPLISNYKTNNSIPFTVSGCIDKYKYNNSNVRYMKSKFDTAYIKKSNILADSKWKFWNKDKIVIAGMTKEIEAVFVKEPLGLGVGIYAIYNFGNFNPFFLTGILNSKYLSFYFINKFKDKHLAGGYLAINKSTIEKLPLEYIDNQLSLSILAQLLSYLTNKFQNKIIFNYFNSILDGLVFELYFEKHMKEKEINISEFVENDINEVMQDKEFENLDDKEKEIIIQKLYNKWTSENSEVKKRIKLFSVKSPDILKPILES